MENLKKLNKNRCVKQFSQKEKKTDGDRVFGKQFAAC